MDSSPKSDNNAVEINFAGNSFKADAAYWAEIRRNNEIRYSKIRDRFSDIELNEWDVKLIDRAEREDAPCINCPGLPCQKSIAKGYRNVIKIVDDNIEIRLCPCEFEKSRREQARISRLFRQSKIPAQYFGKTFADYVIDKNNVDAVDIAKYLIETPTAGAYFYGSFGTGKTFLAAIIAQEIVKQGKAVLFASVPEISSTIRATFNRKKDDEPGEDAVYETLYNVHTLILDDIGTEKPTKFVCEMLGKIINNRYNAQKQTIITSNYDIETIRTIYDSPTDSKPMLDGSRIYDRCKQMCSPVRLRGESRRQSL